METFSSEQINTMMEVFTEDQIKQLIKEHKQLSDTGFLPPDSSYRLLTETICNIYDIQFNLKMGEMWLQNEVFKRFLNKV